MAIKRLILILVILLCLPKHSLAQRVRLTLHILGKSSTFTAEEVTEAIHFLRRNLGSSTNETWSFKTIKILRDSTLLDNIRRVLAVGNKKVLPIHLHLNDEAQIWPYCTAKKVVISEWGLTQSCRNKEDVKAMLIHETAHFVCPSVGLDYYPGVRHSLGSLLSPALSLHEGWANYWTALYSKKLQMGRRSAFTSLYKLRSNGKREKLSGSRLKLRHYLCNSVTVGNLIWDLTCLPNGYKGMEKALKLAWQQKAPTAVDLLAEYVYLYPKEQRTVRELLRNRTRNCGSQEQYDKVLSGTFFLFGERNKLPR